MYQMSCERTHFHTIRWEALPGVPSDHEKCQCHLRGRFLW